MNVFHRTLVQNARAVLTAGWKDGLEYHWQGKRHCGVWFTPDEPPRSCLGGCTLAVEVPDDVAAAYWVGVNLARDPDPRGPHLPDRTRPMREYCLPAVVANRYSVRLVRGHYPGDAATFEAAMKDLAAIASAEERDRLLGQARAVYELLAEHGLADGPGLSRPVRTLNTEGGL